MVAVSLPVLTAGLAFAQGKAKNEKDKLPAPEDMVLETADGVKLAVTWYPSARGKQAVPVILLHGNKSNLTGSGDEFSRLAPFLHSRGHAVLVPDLRGHGESTKKRGLSTSLDSLSMPPAEFTRMVDSDMLRLKQFLLQHNNAGELNIENLCIVGSELGANVALLFTALDWKLPPEGNKKQGQDVKAVVAISPDWSLRGLPISMALRERPLSTMIFDPQLRRVFKDPDSINFRAPVQIDFRREVSVLIMVGKGDSKVLADADRVYNMLKPFHREPANSEKGEKDLYFGKFDTSLQGTTMVDKLNLEKYIDQFIQVRVVDRAFRWEQRKNPYE